MGKNMKFPSLVLQYFPFLCFFIIVMHIHFIQFTISMAMDLNDEDKHFVNEVVLTQLTYKTSQKLSTPMD